MAISGGSWLIIIAGILICFAGILIKKIFEALLGFIWGIATGYLILIILALAGNHAVQNMNDSTVVVILIIAGLILAALSVFFDRLMVAIRGFLISFFIMILILAVASYDMEMTTALAIAVIVAVIVAGVMWEYYKYAFIIECAITGSIMINHIGLMGGANPQSFMSNTINGYRSSDNSTAVVITVLVAIAGIVVQSMILSKMEENGVIGTVKLGGGIHPTSESGLALTSLLPDSHIRKATIAAVRNYEKYLLIAPVIAFLILRLMSRYEYETSSKQIYNVLSQTWQVRHYLELICMGIFEGALIYFVIYYEIKVSAIYQLFALLWLPLELWDLIRYHFSSTLSRDPKYVVMSVGRYVLIWALLLVLDYGLKNEVAKYISMCVVTIFMITTGFSLLFYGNNSFYVDLNNCIHWGMIVMTLTALVYLNKNGKNKRCLKCGIELIDGDSYCRNCGDKIN